jgi:hypothetical protein
MQMFIGVKVLKLHFKRCCDAYHGLVLCVANGSLNKASSQGHPHGYTALIRIDFYRLNSTCEMTQQPD